MKIALLLGIFLVVFIVISCAPQQASNSDEVAGSTPEMTVADQQILEQYPDDLDTALEELEMVE